MHALTLVNWTLLLASGPSDCSKGALDLCIQVLAGKKISGCSSHRISEVEDLRSRNDADDCSDAHLREY